MRREYRFAISAAALLVLLVFAVVPLSAWTATPPVCLFRRTVGVQCLGCGMTRALSHAMHGNVQEALTLNAGVAVVVPALVAAVLAGLRR